MGDPPAQHDAPRENRTEVIFHGALEREGPDREQYLIEACADDADLRARCDALLEAHLDGCSILDQVRSLHRVDTSESSPFDSAHLFGDYAILETLGHGGQGTVYRARDVRLGRTVALKVLNSSLLSGKSATRRFQREAASLSRLDHPGICTVFEAGECEGQPFIAMRYVEGETVAQCILAARDDGGTEVALTSSRNTGRTDRGSDSTQGGKIHRLLEFFQHAALALHEAHEAGLIHRDIKPGNIMVSETGDPVLVDFGLVRDEGSDAVNLTQSGDVLGTPLYMSPEQVDGSGVIDLRTDIYSLAATLYECLTLESPFAAATREQIYQRILRSEVGDPRRRNRAIPADLKIVLETALERDRERRYESALAFAEDLRRVRELLPIRARRASRALRAKRWTQRNPLIAMSMVAVIALLTTGLLISWNYNQQLERSLRKSRSQTLTAASQNLLGQKSSLSLLLALEAVEQNPSPLALGQLLCAAMQPHELARFDDFNEPPFFAEFSPDSLHYLAGSMVDGVRILDLSGAEVASIPVDDGKMLSINFDRQGQNIVLTTARHLHAGRFDGSAAVYTLNGRQRVRFPHPGPVATAAFSPDGKQLLTGCKDGAARIFKIDSPRDEALVLPGHRAPISSVAFSPDGRRIATGSRDGTVCIWDLDENGGWQSQPLLRAHSSGLSRVEFSPDGTATPFLPGPRASVPLP